VPSPTPVTGCPVLGLKVTSKVAKPGLAVRATVTVTFREVPVPSARPTAGAWPTATATATAGAGAVSPSAPRPVATPSTTVRGVRISWGDGGTDSDRVPALPASSAPAVSGQTKTLTFPHVYKRSGTYLVTVSGLLDACWASPATATAGTTVG
jgi:hypothetical protein